jgi:hypothetical protein
VPPLPDYRDCLSASAILRRLAFCCRQRRYPTADNRWDRLKSPRKKLDDDGHRVQRDIVEYASLSQSVIQLTKIVSEGMTHVKKVPDAPIIAVGATISAEVSLEEQV